jgi:hypothetical protein
MDTRRRFLYTLGSAAAVTLTGCTDTSTTSSESTVEETPTRGDLDRVHTESEANQTDVPVEEGTPVNMPNDEDPDRDLTPTEHYFEWIYGEDEQILENVQDTDTGISFDAINNALEQGMNEGGRNEAISQGILEAANQYTPQAGDNYEDIHQHVLSALHHTLQDEQYDWNINIKSNINAVLTPSGLYPYTEIEVQQNDGTTDIINAYIGQNEEHAARTPSDDEAVSGDNLSGTTDILNGIRDGQNYAHIPSHDTEAFDDYIDDGGDEERTYDQLRVISGMQIREGSYTNQDDHIAYTPDNLIVADDIEDVRRINETKYENGDTSLVDELNDKYMDEYEDTDTAVRWTSTETEDGYEVEMWEDPDFNLDEEIAEA